MNEKVKRSTRVHSIDILRGLVMVLMALDHTRTFFLGTGINPTNLEQTTPILFLTRWITHFCAPSFILLAGAGAFLYGYGKEPTIRRHFLWTRGLWLILLELTVIKFGWAPEPFYMFLFLQVIWVLGWSMLILAPLSHLSPSILTILGLLVMLLHNTLDTVNISDSGPLAFLWAVLHVQQTFEPISDHFIFVTYPIIPWVAVMASGFGLGSLYLKTNRVRLRLLSWIGVGLSFAFVVLRLLNHYGNSMVWTKQPTIIYSILSFLNCEKYPPSLTYLLMTLGPILVLLSVLERQTNWGMVGEKLILLGRVPLFFYVMHLYLLRITSLILARIRWGETAFLPPPEGHLGSPEYSLWAVYFIFAIAILVLYPLCKAYANLKAKHTARYRWLRYL